MSTIITGGLGGPSIITQGYEDVFATTGCVEVTDFSLYRVEVSDNSCAMGANDMGFNVHDYGDLVRVDTGEDGFRDELLGGALDPDTVNLTIRAPDGTITNYVYGTDAEIVRDDLGKYHADIDANQSGAWRYRWWSTGTGQASEERQFQVRVALAVEV
jgi:hypothetical protein